MANLQILLNRNTLEYVDTNFDTNVDTNKDIEIIEKEQLLQNLRDIQEIQTNIISVVERQDEKLDSIANNLIYAENHIEKAEIELKEASRLQLKYLPIVLGGGLGFAMFGPLGLIPGFKFGGLATGASAGLIGSVIGYKYQ